MASVTLKLSNRSPKQPIKRLPASVDVSATTTVEDLKVLIAKKSNISDYNRIGIFDTATKKTLKDRRARVLDVEAVASANEVLVKDLGMQISWRTVFVIEYIGPILAFPLMIWLRPYIYKNATGDMTAGQWLACGMIVLHFLKREFETLFVHRFSANTMPVFNVFKNSAHYWLMSGLLSAWDICSPASLAAGADLPAVDALGSVLFLFGEVCNAAVHLYLATLRSPGGTERQIPRGYGFALVTCPNYMFEVLAWLGIILVSRSWAVTLFIAVGMVQMSIWAKGKEKAYRKEFGDKYKKKRYSMLPGLF